MLSILEPQRFRSLLRRCTVTAIILGVVGTAVALFLDSPLGALGIALGVGLGFLNVRSIDRQVSRADVDPEASRRSLRRMMGSRSALRLAVLTIIAIGLVLVVAPLGIGVVVGLVLFQLAFVSSVVRALVAQDGAP